jgi:hypothetical protein
MRGRTVVLALLIAGITAAATAWWLRAREPDVSVDQIGDRVQTLPRGRLPVFAAPADVAGLYRFATERGDVLRWMPCTCGCADLGHASNRACYIKSEDAGRVTYTSHAAT